MMIHTNKNRESLPEKAVFLLFGSQLFDPTKLPVDLSIPTILIEHSELCQYFRFHKHKIIYFLSAMRHYRQECQLADRPCRYLTLEDTHNHPSYEDSLNTLWKQEEWTHLHFFEIEDKFMEQRLLAWLNKNKQKINYTIWPNPNFLTSRELGRQQIQKGKRPFMKTFYEWQRRRLKILVDSHQEPIGGQWSFDTENRLPWPKSKTVPQRRTYQPDPTDQEVFKLVESRFPNHPGDPQNFWIPTARSEAREWLRDFIQQRLAEFGPFEDAMGTEDPVLHHSVLTPFLNTGLLNPEEVVTEVLRHRDHIPLNSLEGFIRQIIGWREFIRLIYQNYSEIQDTTNFFQHQKKLNAHWYNGTTGCPPLDQVIKKTQRLAWCHHIERLMILANMMNLCEIHPHEAHRWFMELFIDSSDWVMGPNVYGMGLMSDGGIFATKPYICGSNYWLKMGRFEKGPWCQEVDGLYWRFVREKSAILKQNPRLSMMVKTYQKMSSEKKEALESAALGFIKRNTL